jgi:hypothetical protein
VAGVSNGMAWGFIDKTEKRFCHSNTKR